MPRPPRTIGFLLWAATLVAALLALGLGLGPGFLRVTCPALKPWNTSDTLLKSATGELSVSSTPFSIVFKLSVQTKA